MNLSEPQADLQEALEHAKWVLARTLHPSELRQANDPDIVAGFYSELRQALDRLATAVQAHEGGPDSEHS